MCDHDARNTHDRNLERIKAELRREIEQDLLAHESRLRVRAEIELKLHQRSWDLLREVQEAGMAAHEALSKMLGITTADDFPGAANLQKVYDATQHPMRKLKAISQCVPPRHRMISEASSEFENIFNELIGHALAPDDVGSRFKTGNNIHKHLEKVINNLGAEVRRWNEELWAEHSKTVESLSTVQRRD